MFSFYCNTIPGAHVHLNLFFLSIPWDVGFEFGAQIGKVAIGAKKVTKMRCRRKNTMDNKMQKLVVMQNLKAKKQTDRAEAKGTPLGTVKSYWQLYCLRGTTDNLPKSGSTQSVCTEKVIKAVKVTIDKNPNQSIQSFGRQFNVVESVMRGMQRKIWP